MSKEIIELEAKFKLDMEEIQKQFLSKEIYTAEEYLRKKSVLESSFKYECDVLNTKLKGHISWLKPLELKIWSKP